MASAMWSSWPVLTIIFHIPEELWSSAKVQSHSVLMLLWSCPHMFWQMSLILFSWASIQRLPLLSLQEAHTLLWYFLQAVHMGTSSVPEHDMKTPEAVSMLESSTFSLNDSESEEVWSPVLFKLPATVLSTRSTLAVGGLERGLPGSCPHCSNLSPVSFTNLVVFSLPQAELCSLLSSIYGEPMWVLLSQWSPWKLLEEWSCLFGVGVSINPGNGHPTGGVPTKGMSGKRGITGGGVPVGCFGLL